MTIPEAAIEAAAEAARRYRIKSWSAENYEPTPWNTVAEPIRKGMLAEAHVALEAAMPAIREAIANELHAALCTDPNCEDVCVGAANAVEVVLEGFEL